MTVKYWNTTSTTTIITAASWLPTGVPAAADDLIIDVSRLSGSGGISITSGTSTVTFNSLTIIDTASRPVTITGTASMTIGNTGGTTASPQFVMTANTIWNHTGAITLQGSSQYPFLINTGGAIIKAPIILGSSSYTGGTYRTTSTSVSGTGSVISGTVLTVASTSITGTNTSNVTATNCTTSGTVLTVGPVTSGSFAVGTYISGTDSSGSSIPYGTYITSLGTGTGGAGTYNISSPALDGDGSPVNLGATTITGVLTKYATGTASTIGNGSSSTIAGTVLTIGGVVTGTFTTGMVLSGTGVLANTKITSQVSGTTGGAGTYNIDKSQAIGGTVSGSSTFAVGTYLSGTGVLPGTYITSLGTGTGGAGTYNVNQPHYSLIVPTTITGTLPSKTSATLFLSYGTLDVSTNDFWCGIFSSSATTTRSIAFGSAGNGIYLDNTTTGTTTLFAITNGTGFTYTGTSKIVLLNSGTGLTKNITTTGLSNATQALNFNFTDITGGSNNITVTANSYFRDFDATNWTSSGSFANSARTIYGDLKLYPSTTWTGGTTTTNITTFTSGSFTKDTGIDYSGASGVGPITINNISSSTNYQTFITNMNSVGAIILNNVNSSSITNIFSTTTAPTITFSGATGSIININSSITGAITHSGVTVNTAVYYGYIYATTYTHNSGILNILDSGADIVTCTGKFTSAGGRINFADDANYSINCFSYSNTSASTTLAGNFSLYYLDYLPRQIKVVGRESTGSTISITATPTIAYGDVGFSVDFDNTSNSTLTVTDATGVLNYTFATSPIAIAGCSFKGLDLVSQTKNVILPSSTSVVNVYADYYDSGTTKYRTTAIGTTNATGTINFLGGTTTTASGTGTISNTTLTLSSIASGKFVNGAFLSGTGVLYGNTISGQLTATNSPVATTTATGSSGVNAIVLANTASVQAGQLVAGTGIYPGTFVDIEYLASRNTTSVSRTANTATAIFNATTLPQYLLGSSITITGVTPATFNGTFTVTGCTKTSVSWADTNGIATASVQGTISGKTINLVDTTGSYSKSTSAAVSIISFYTPGNTGTYELTRSDTVSSATSIAGVTYAPKKLYMYASSALPAAEASIALNLNISGRYTTETAFYYPNIVTTGNITASSFLNLSYSTITCNNFSMSGFMQYNDTTSITIKGISGTVLSAGTATFYGGAYGSKGNFILDATGTVTTNTRTVNLPSSEAHDTLDISFTTTNPQDKVVFSGNVRGLYLSNYGGIADIANLKCVYYSTIVYPGSLFTKNVNIFKNLIIPSASVDMDFTGGDVNNLNLRLFGSGSIFVPDMRTFVNITSVSRTTTTATVTFDALPYRPYKIYSYITITGVTPNTFNGTFFVTACTTTSVSWSDTRGSVATALAQGTIVSVVGGVNLYVNDKIDANNGQLTFATLNILNNSTFGHYGSPGIEIEDGGSYTCVTTAALSNLFNINFDSTSPATFNTGGKAYGNVSVKNNNTEAATTFTINNSGNTAAINTLTLQDCIAYINNNLTITNIIAPSTNQYNSGITLRNTSASTFTFSTLTALTPNYNFYISTDNGTSNQVTVNFNKLLLIGTNSTVNTTGATSPYISKVATGYTVSTLYVYNSNNAGNANIVFVYTGPTSTTSTSNFFLIF